jgi:hypothetical protein
VGHAIITEAEGREALRLLELGVEWRRQGPFRRWIRVRDGARMMSLSQVIARPLWVNDQFEVRIRRWTRSVVVVPGPYVTDFLLV